MKLDVTMYKVIGEGEPALETTIHGSAWVKPIKIADNFGEVTETRVMTRDKEDIDKYTIGYIFYV